MSETTSHPCDHNDFERRNVDLPGTVRGETFTVQMNALVCRTCGYTTIEGVEMAEYGRLLSDKYREKQGLLTSDEIRARRSALDMSQDEFATFLGVGIASIKRWEMGKIQDESNDELIRRKTDPTSTVNAIIPNGRTGLSIRDMSEAIVGAISNSSTTQQLDFFLSSNFCAVCKYHNRYAAENQFLETLPQPAHIAAIINERERRTTCPTK